MQADNRFLISYQAARVTQGSGCAVGSACDPGPSQIYYKAEY
jgi:hypothetical protein